MSFSIIAVGLARLILVPTNVTSEVIVDERYLALYVPRS